MSKLLILGGTSEARALARALAAAGQGGEVRLAGRVPQAAPYALPTRTGGFGGAAGLAAYLRAGGFTALLDATHPFAAQMPWQAAEAATRAGLPRAHLKRAPWAPAPGDDWRDCSDLARAAAALPPGARAFLATGAGSVAAFAGRRDCALHLRAMVAPPDLPAHITLHLGQPGTEAEERALFQRLSLTHLVTKNSGGPARDKLTAARRLGLPVLMIARPPLPEGQSFADVASALAWVAALP